MQWLIDIVFEKVMLHFSGMILMWSGSIASVPDGWQFCDGTNGTPDLRDRFVAGARQDVGGVAKTSVTGLFEQVGGTITHNHTLGVGEPIPLGTPIFNAATNFTAHIPPFYALAFIMKL